MDTFDVIRVSPKGLEVGTQKWADTLVKLARNAAGYVASDCRPLARFVKELETGRAWKIWLKDEPKTRARFCTEALGIPEPVLKRWIDGIDLLESNGHSGPIPQAEALAAVEKFGPIGEAVHPGSGRGNKTSNNMTRFRRGTSASYLARRIARDRPDILKRMKAGEFKSVHAAAREAGLIKTEYFSVPLDPEGAARTIKRRFTAGQIRKLKELL
jgi:hypothetical protein